MARTPRSTRRRTVTKRIIKSQAVEQVVDAQPQAEELTLERAIEIMQRQRAQVETCRRMFFRLAEVRAAELVQYQNKSWSDGSNYINAEMQGLDAALAEHAL